MQVFCVRWCDTARIRVGTGVVCLCVWSVGCTTARRARVYDKYNALKKEIFVSRANFVDDVKRDARCIILYVERIIFLIFFKNGFFSYEVSYFFF